jgi:hypothetical protein
MIMSLIANKIPIVIGWNHKYEEILGSIKFSDLNLEISDKLLDKTISKYEDIATNFEEFTNKLLTNKPNLDISENFEQYL